MSNSKVRRFGTAKRRPLNEDLKSKFLINLAPEPGNYQLPSDFGYYMNKSAVSKGLIKNKSQLITMR
jgi:hypothetical protein